jgi:hypothetical protein
VIALAVCLARWHALKASVTATAIVASIILPPWMFPARGIVIIAIGSLHQRAKQFPPHRFDATVPVHISARAEQP